MNHDTWVSDTRRNVARLLCRMAGNNPPDLNELVLAIDGLNRAWDGLTDALVRQREERDKVVIHLMNELAERKPR